MRTVTSSSSAPPTDAPDVVTTPGVARRAVTPVAAGVASGVLFWAANPAPDLGLLAFVALVPMFAVATTWRRGMLAGAVGGVVAYLLVLRWVVPVAWFVWPVLAAWCAVFWALAVACAGSLWRRTGPVLWAFAVASAWVVAEWWRGMWPFGGFAWGELGTTQAGVAATRSLAAALGVLGVSWGVAAVNAALAVVVRSAVAHGRPRRREVTATLSVVGVVVVLFGLGVLFRPRAAPTGVMRVAVVQANRFEDGDVWPEKMLREHLALTREVALSDDAVDLYVWGESSIWDQPVTDELLASVAAASGGVPVVANAYVRIGDRLWANETLVVGTGGVETGRYRKRHPVPWGEFVPFRSVLEPVVPQIARVPRDAVRGTGPGVVDVDGVAVGLLICFESLFPRDARSTVDAGAELLVVTTNNSTFGRSDLSAQYLAGSRMRAVETHRGEVVTSVNGRSAVFGPDGTVLRRTGLWDATTAVVDVPLHDDRTLSVRLGVWPMLVPLLLIPVAFEIGRRRGAAASSGDIVATPDESSPRRPA